MLQQVLPLYNSHILPSVCNRVSNIVVRTTMYLNCSAINLELCHKAQKVALVSMHRLQH